MKISLSGLKKNKKIKAIFIIILVSASGYYINDKLKYREPGPLSDPDSWSLILEDNFEGNSLDNDTWSKGYPPGDWNCWGHCSNHHGWMAPENVIIEDGLLRIKGENKTHPEAIINRTDEYSYYPLNYTTGAITSLGKFEFKYGYIEARMKMPRGPTGFWPAFWTLSDSWPSWGEIDIVEWYSGRYKVYTTNLHTRAEDDTITVSDIGIHKTSTGLTKNFHIFGMEWVPDRISFYFDNIEVRRITDVSRIQIITPQHIRINLAVGGWNGEPDENTIWPAWFETDWVRVWQHKDY